MLNELLILKNEAIGDACETKTIHKYSLYTELFREAHSASWSMGTGLTQLGREADDSIVVRRLRMHEAFPTHLHMLSSFAQGQFYLHLCVTGLYWLLGVS